MRTCGSGAVSEQIRGFISRAVAAAPGHGQGDEVSSSRPENAEGLKPAVRTPETPELMSCLSWIVLLRGGLSLGFGLVLLHHLLS